jgi:thioredoxin 1
MKELLLAFILALIIGSIINGWPQQPQAKQAGQGTSTPASASTGSASLAPTVPHRDFPDFNSFPSLNQANFANVVLASKKPVFIICYSPHNLSYERMVPLVAALAQEHADSTTVTKLDILENASLAQKYEIYTVPTFLVFSKGEPVAKLAGIVAKDKLEAMITTAKL